MMTSDSLITLASAIGEAAVIVSLVRSRIWRNLPIFSSYVLWAFLSDCAALYFQNHGIPEASYLLFYRIMVSVDALLQFTVLVELAWSVLRPVRTSLPRGTIFVLAALVAIVGLIIWPMATMTIPHNLRGESRTIFHLLETFAILRIVCFLFMAAFSQILSIGWRDRELQIATGLGFYSIVSLIVTLFNSHQLDMTRSHQFNVAVSVSYLCTLAYWVLSFAAKEYQRKEFSPQMQQLLVYMGGAARAGSIALTDMPPGSHRKKD
jgi:hypothetical protein